jgi:hypothetical protein
LTNIIPEPATPSPLRWHVIMHSDYADTTFSYTVAAGDPRSALELAWARHMAIDASPVDAVDIEPWNDEPAGTGL